MPNGDLPPGFDLTQFGNGLWVLLMALVSGAAGLTAYRRQSPPPQAQAVTASLIDVKTLERLIMSFEATARVLERSVQVWEQGNKGKELNNELLDDTNRRLKELRDQLEEAVKRARELTYQLEINSRSANEKR